LRRIRDAAGVAVHDPALRIRRLEARAAAAAAAAARDKSGGDPAAPGQPAPRVALPAVLLAPGAELFVEVELRTELVRH
jgi:hypothetical protein